MINDRQADDLVDTAIQARLYDLKVCLPGIVQAYNAAAMTVDVLPVGGTYQDGDAAAWPVLPDVPVCFPMFGGGQLTFPLGPGDPVTLVFSSRAIDGWAADGIADDPQSPRFGHLSDAMAIPGGVLPAAQRSASASAENVTLTERTGGSILVGSGASLGAARVTDTVSQGAALATWMTAVGAALNTLGQSVTPLVGTTIGAIASGSAVVKIGG